MTPVRSYAQRLQDQLRAVEAKMMDLIDASTIRTFHGSSVPGIVIVRPDHYWGRTDEKQKRLQMEVLGLYDPWIEHMGLLFSGASNEILQQIKEADAAVRRWVQKELCWDLPATIDAAKRAFQKHTAPFHSMLAMLSPGEDLDVVLVPDTNALTTCAEFDRYQSVAGQPRFSVILTPTVLGELDLLKVTGRDEGFREKVRSVISRIKGLRAQGSLLTGVTVNKTITLRMLAVEPDFSHTLSWLDEKNNDDRIVASVLEIQRREPASVVIVVTGDINLQNKAEMANIPCAEPPETS